MKWSQLKQRVESMLAPSVHDRLELHATRYRHAHDAEGRAWITIDGEEVHSFASIEFVAESYSLATEITRANGGSDSRWPSYAGATRSAEQIAAQRGLMTLEDVYRALERYLRSPIEDALVDEALVVRALAVCDRRLGKRRRARLELRTDEHALVHRCLALRRDAERLGQPEPGRRARIAHGPECGTPD